MKTIDPEKAKEYFESKIAYTLGPMELKHMMQHKKNINIVDVRDAEDYAQEHIPGAVNLPSDQWKTLEGLDKDKTNILYCYSQVCHLAAHAGARFAAQGYQVMELEGGFDVWKKYELPIEK
jgi:rhodanese-related sulfurtransferase